MDHELTVPWLLVATPQLMDSNFRKTVVLIVEHTEAGAMGFVLNRPCHAPLADLVVVDDLVVPEDLSAWLGGPCDTTTGIILHNRDEEDPDFDLGGGMILSSSESTLADMIQELSEHPELGGLRSHDSFPSSPSFDEGSCLYPYRFLVGYSGWGAGQLEEELRSGAWIQAPLNRELLFNTPWTRMWDEAMALSGVNPRVLAPSVQPYLN